MDEWLVLAVKARANDACEYCRVPQSAYPGITFPIDHVLARYHGGPTRLSNLANACLHCNSHKGSHVAGFDPVTGRLTKLFHPRRHRWGWHFRWEGAYLVGRTPIGRTTIDVLRMNDSMAVWARIALIVNGDFPPDP